ncbi:MAG: DUF2007 domain-containing protein [Chloroflexi bacterium]|nr:MAG: DUF2007 domain-containing protein [Chloroflexota bacterium]
MSVKGWSVVFKGERLQADLIAAILEADGIEVEVFGDNAYGVGIDLTEARLMVPDDQAQAARRVIKQAEERPLEADEEDVVEGDQTPASRD